MIARNAVFVLHLVFSICSTSPNDAAIIPFIVDVFTLLCILRAVFTADKLKSSDEWDIYSEVQEKAGNQIKWENIISYQHSGIICVFRDHYSPLWESFELEGLKNNTFESAGRLIEIQYELSQKNSLRNHYKVTKVASCETQ